MRGVRRRRQPQDDAASARWRTAPRSATATTGEDTLLLTNQHVAEWPAVTDADHPVDGVPAGCKRVADALRIVDNDHDDYAADDVPLTRVVVDPALDIAVLSAKAKLRDHAVEGRQERRRARARRRRGQGLSARRVQRDERRQGRVGVRPRRLRRRGTTTTSWSTRCSPTAARARRCSRCRARPASSSSSACSTRTTAGRARSTWWSRSIRSAT